MVDLIPPPPPRWTQVAIDGDKDMLGYILKNLGTPVDPADSARKTEVDTHEGKTGDVHGVISPDAVAGEPYVDKSIAGHAAIPDAHHANTRHDAVRGLLAQGHLAYRWAAGIQGRLYYATDEGVLYRDTGTEWEEKLRAETATRLAYLAERAHASLTGIGPDDHHVMPIHQALETGLFTGQVTTNSTTWVDLPGMSITITTGERKVLVIASFNMTGGAAGWDVDVRLLLDGVTTLMQTGSYIADPWADRLPPMARLVKLTAGTHTIKVQWRVRDPAQTAFCWQRNLCVIELRDAT